MENFKDWSSLLPLRPSSIDNIPSDVIGIYGFWYKYSNRCIYIGKAENQSIRMRVKQEYENSHNSQLNEWIEFFRNSLEIRYFSCDKTHDINKLEQEFTSLWDAETNLTNRRN